MASPARTTHPPVTLAGIEAAAARIAGAVIRTPTMLSRTLSERSGATVYVKFENLQHTGAYKERGALNKLLLMDPARRSRGVIAASAGNHAQAVAYHARRLGVPAVIVMPKPTPIVKVSQTEAHGAEVVLFGETFDEAYAESRRLAEERGLTFVHPFDDAEVMAGQGTVALELLADAPEIDALVIPIGGGGLISGIATAAKALKPGIAVVGAQAELYPSMYAKLSGQSLPCAGDTIAEGIAVKAPGVETADIIREVVDDIVLVSERDIESALCLLATAEKTVAEGAGAVGLAALLSHPDRFAGKTVGLVVSGGNIDTHLFANVLLRDLVRSGRMTRLRIHLQDRPGALVAVMKLFSAHQVNIVEVNHQRVFTSLPAKDAAIEVACEARDAGQIAKLIETLEGDGYKVFPVALE
ncbi:threonine ammonia-lyase [Sphingosinicella sp. LHD-64]|uniref:threonine ammonia-lyase n=1 Tax=Sphingosinicella sp. LHD-64 TaxID=3072139 RepID=UPI00280F2456|nr:threonine ammonia-lyase [Sphingosinicella sp. LHD-64]MDQ8756345.1 threonine ammonia-lyase [Sphingosinicella sp. LHD-64]